MNKLLIIVGSGNNNFKEIMDKSSNKPKMVVENFFEIKDKGVDLLNVYDFYGQYGLNKTDFKTEDYQAILMIGFSGMINPRVEQNKLLVPTTFSRADIKKIGRSDYKKLRFEGYQTKYDNKFGKKIAKELGRVEEIHLLSVKEKIVGFKLADNLKLVQRPGIFGGNVELSGLGGVFKKKLPSGEETQSLFGFLDEQSIDAIDLESGFVLKKIKHELLGFILIPFDFPTKLEYFEFKKEGGQEGIIKKLTQLIDELINLWVNKPGLFSK